MYCPNCGKEIKDGSKFCPLCGKATTAQAAPPQQPVQQVQQQFNQTVHKVKAFDKPKKIITAVIAIIVLFIGILAVSDSDADIVKSGHFNFNQKVTVGKAFDNFFGDTKWDEKVVGDTHYVYFTGTMSDPQDGSDDEMKITFTVNPKNKSFNVTKMTVNELEIIDDRHSVLQQIVSGQKQIHYSYF